MQKRSIIIGANGQDGQLLSRLLNNRGHDVYQITRQNFDILNFESVTELIKKFQPDELYFLAAFHVSSEVASNRPDEVLRQSFDISVIALGYFLQAIHENASKCAVFNASSSLIFQEDKEALLKEDSPKNPLSFYSNAKLAGMNLCDHYAHDHGLKTFNGVLFNHESIYRSDRFLSKKIVKGAVNIKNGKQKVLNLHSLTAEVDWSSAQDFVQGMYLLLNSEAKSGNYIFASGISHTVEDFANIAFSYLGLNYKDHISLTPSLQVRRPEVRIGDSTKLRNATGWKSTMTFEKMITTMIDYEMKNESK